MKIASRDNEKLKFARRVRDGKESGFIFIEGKRLCLEAVQSGIPIEIIFATEHFRESADEHLHDSANLFEITEPLLDSIADTQTPQGIVIIARRPADASIDEFFTTSDVGLPLWIYLYKVSNPSNLGAVIRTAEAAGIRGVIVSEGSADPFSPKSVRASMGSLFRMPIISGVPTTDLINVAMEKGIRTAAVGADGKSNYLEVDWNVPTILIFGSEATGVPADAKRVADESIMIPMNSSVESLNLAVSCGIILFEAVRKIRSSESG
ncbi:MAG: TrmH family RNA methyltransferase [Pyrinomonadaceae bacterium]